MTQNNNTPPTIWKTQEEVSRRLLAWNLINVAVGTALQITGRGKPVLRAFGSQNIGWGVINMGIAVIGRRMGRRRAALPDTQTPATLHKESRNLRRLLWVNAGLDLFYMLGGLTMARRNKDNPNMRGNGLGIVLQGLLLFIFDVVQALRVPNHPKPDGN